MLKRLFVLFSLEKLLKAIKFKFDLNAHDNKCFSEYL